MKNSETDREFVDLIKSTLDNYEEPYILGSWENFARSKKRRRRHIIWFSSTGIAASLLIGWLGFRFILPGFFSSDTDHPLQRISNLEISTAEDTPGEQPLIRQDPAIAADHNGTQGLLHDQALQSTPELRHKNQVREEIIYPDHIPGNAGVDTSGSRYDSYPLPENVASHLPDTVSNNSESRDITSDRQSLISEQHRSDSSEGKPSYRQDDVTIIPDNDPADKKRSQKFRFGFNIAPGVTSTNTNSSFNYSGGINADFDLSRSFRLSTGLQVEHHTVINESSDNPAWIPPGQNQAELVDLDLPLNLTWKFLIRKSTCYYLSGGISSVLYLSENYTSTSYTQKMVQTVEMSDGMATVNYQLENVKTTEQTTEAPLSTFDFAGRINIIFGFEQHLSSRLFLHLEPYIKIPVSELASRNLSYTTSGITCKISF